LPVLCRKLAAEALITHCIAYVGTAPGNANPNAHFVGAQMQMQMQNLLGHLCRNLAPGGRAFDSAGGRICAGFATNWLQNGVNSPT